jgi:hypothetical protein
LDEDEFGWSGRGDELRVEPIGIDRHNKVWLYCLLVCEVDSCVDQFVDWQRVDRHCSVVIPVFGLQEEVASENESPVPI